jgi:hypothetical protein
MAYVKLVDGTKAIKLRNIGKFLFTKRYENRNKRRHRVLRQ